MAKFSRPHCFTHALHKFKESPRLSFYLIDRAHSVTRQCRMMSTVFSTLILVVQSIPRLDALDANFGLFSGTTISRRRLQSAGELCNQTVQQVMTGSTQDSFEWECSCSEVSNALDGTRGAYHMTCQSTCGQFCNRRNDVCLIPGFIQGFDSNGVNYLFSQTYQYTLGRQEYIDRRVFFNLAGSPLTCRYEIDESTCQSCEITPCTSGGAPIELHCENLLEGTTYDFCADPTPAVDEGVFQFLNPEDFLTCSPLPLPVPTQLRTTSPPVLSPTIRPMMGKVVPEQNVGPPSRASRAIFRSLGILLAFISTLHSWL